MKKRYVIMPALQMPHESKIVLAAIIRFIEAYQPDEVIQLGSLACAKCAEICSGRQPPASAREGIHSPIKVDKYVTEKYLTPLRSVFSGHVRINSLDIRTISATVHNGHQSNARSSKWTETRHNNTAETDYDIGKLPAKYPLAPRWVALTMKGRPTSEIPGRESWDIAKHLGISVLTGNTMHLAKATHTVRRDDRTIRSVTGVEVGHCLDLTDPANRQFRVRHAHGFVVVETNGNSVNIECIPTSPKMLARSIPIGQLSFPLQNT